QGDAAGLGEGGGIDRADAGVRPVPHVDETVADGGRAGPDHTRPPVALDLGGREALDRTELLGLRVAHVPLSRPPARGPPPPAPGGARRALGGCAGWRAGGAPAPPREPGGGGAG